MHLPISQNAIIFVLPSGLTSALLPKMDTDKEMNPKKPMIKAYDTKSSKKRTGVFL